MAHDFEFFGYRKHGKIARVTINRPHVLNAVHFPAARELEHLADHVAADTDTRIVAITGAGRAFSTGMDLKELPKGEVDIGYHEHWERALRRFETMDKIVLCLLHGYAIGGGLQLALACDIRVGTRSVDMSLPAVTECLIPGLGTFRLARYIGLGRAKRMTLLGSRIYGEEAERIGLLDHLVDEPTMEEEFEGLIQQYLETCSTACRLSKQALVACFDLGFDQFFDYYLDLQNKAMNSSDYREALAALKADRRPVWK